MTNEYDGNGPSDKAAGSISSKAGNNGIAADAPSEGALPHRPGEITLLKRREIEALIAVPLIEGLAAVAGREKALETASQVIKELAQASGSELADRLGGNTISHLAKAVREVWAKDNALELVILQTSDLALDFDVTRCAYAEKYHEMGIREFGFCLSCSRDEAFVKGFNPRISLRRTQTIMEGAPFCDFRFSLE